MIKHHVIIFQCLIVLLFAVTATLAIPLPATPMYSWRARDLGWGVEEPIIPIDDEEEGGEVSPRRKKASFRGGEFGKPPKNVKKLSKEEIAKRYTGSHHNQRPTKKDDVYF